MNVVAGFFTQSIVLSVGHAPNSYSATHARGFALALDFQDRFIGALSFRQEDGMCIPRNVSKSTPVPGV